MNADAVLATILVAHQVGVTPQQRAAAVQMDQQVRQNVHLHQDSLASSCTPVHPWLLGDVPRLTPPAIGPCS